MEKIILNPAYQLRRDGNRAIIVYQDRINDFSEDWFSFIHPLHAQLLSFFKGIDSYEIELENCANYFQLPIDTMRNIVNPFINNKHWFGVAQDNGECIHFPKNVLVSKVTGVYRRTFYDAEDFPYYENPNFTNWRLSMPIAVNIELTMKCYVDCCYCYANRHLRNPNVLTLHEMLNFIEEAKRLGILQIDITGGEVLLHPHIREILKKLTELDFHPLISTKMPIEKDLMYYIKSLGISILQISLDSANIVTLNKMIKAKQDYLFRMEETLRGLSELGMETHINAVLTRYNASLGEITDLLLFLSKHKSVKQIRLNPAGYSLYKSEYLDYSPTKEQMEIVESHLMNIQSMYPHINIILGGYEKSSDYSMEKRELIFSQRAICTGNLRNIVILPNGDVTICEELYDNPKFIIGNIRRQSLSDIWKSSRALELYNFSFKSNTDSTCHSCNYMMDCRTKFGVCWKTVLMAYGDQKWDYPDPRCPKAPYPNNCFFVE